MGRDEHRRKKNNPLAQTPKQQIRNEMDIEFSEEFAETSGREEQTRKRMKQTKRNEL